MALACAAGFGCASTRGYQPAPDAALGEVGVALRRRTDGVALALRNDSAFAVQYLFPLFACSRDGALHEDSDPRAAARFASDGPQREIWELILRAGERSEARLTRSPCADPAERAGVFFKLERAGTTTYRVVWSDPIGADPAGL